MVVVVSAIAPFRDVRDQVRAAHEANGSLYLEVHVSTPVEVASERDVKGLYAGRRVGEISGLTGVDDPYGEPLAPDLVIATHEHPVEDADVLGPGRLAPLSTSASRHVYRPEMHVRATHRS